MIQAKNVCKNKTKRKTRKKVLQRAWGGAGGVVVDNRCTDNFPSIESTATLGSFTLEARPLGKTRPYDIEKDKLICDSGV